MKYITGTLLLNELNCPSVVQLSQCQVVVDFEIFKQRRVLTSSIKDNFDFDSKSRSIDLELG